MQHLWGEKMHLNSQTVLVWFQGAKQLGNRTPLLPGLPTTVQGWSIYNMQNKGVYFEWCHCTKPEVSYDEHWMNFWMVFQVMWPSLPTLCLRRWCSNWGWWYWWMKTAEWKSQEWTERTQSTCTLPPGLVLLAPTLIPFQQPERGPSSDQILGPSEWRQVSISPCTMCTVILCTVNWLLVVVYCAL